MTYCYDNLVPLVRRHGTVIAHGADNLLAVFDRPHDAVRAAREMHLWLRRRNQRVSDAEQFSLCIGIHHGKVLRLEDNVYGDPVNVAAKVGEDLAGKDEILVTHKAARLLPASVKKDYSRSAEIGGLTYELYKVRY
jgi:class 3 adenylate cyclase